MRTNRARSVAKWSVLALAALAVLIVWEKPHVAALDSEVQALVDLCESPGGLNRKAMAVQELCDTDTADSKRALKLLAKSGDDRVAMLALAALGREDFSGAEDAIKDVLEDTKRSDAARESAMAAYCRLKDRDGKSWSQVSGYVNTRASGNARLEDAADAVKAKLWGGER